MSEKPPAFQFYPKDFLSDEHVIAMSCSEAGIYIRLIAHCWISESLPNDAKILMRMALTGETEFTAAWPAVAACFVLTDGRWRHPRLDREREKQEAHREQQQRNAEARWNPKAKVATAMPPHSDGTQMVVPPECSSSASSSSSAFAFASSSSSPSASASSEKTITITAARAARSLRVSPDGFEDFWRAYPRKTAKGAAIKAWAKIAPTPETQALMGQALEWQRTSEQWVRDGGHFIPHPSTWLNQSRWLDEPPATPVLPYSERTRQNLANAQAAIADFQARRPV